MVIFRFASKLATAIIGLSLFFTSCGLNTPPPDLYTDPDAINSVSSARSLLASAYESYPHYEYELSVLGTDFCPTPNAVKNIDQLNFYRWQESTLTRFAEEAWLGYYHTIALCDVLLERTEKVQKHSKVETDQLEAIVAETNTLRAMCYFNLLKLFAPAYDLSPDADGIIIKTRIGVEEAKRSTVRTCTDSIETWLKRAERINNTPKQNGWLSRTATKYLLAELMLYKGEYTQASQYAEQVLEESKKEYFNKDGIRSLWSGYSSPTRIFAFHQLTPYYTGIEYDAKEGDYFALAPNVIWANNDIRKEVYTLNWSEKDVAYFLLGKYNAQNKTEAKSSYIDMMRYQKMIFVAAEAYARTPNNIKKAVSIVNSLLSEYQCNTLPETIQEEALIDAILAEKQKEFIGEGVTYFDLKRIHKYSLKRWSTWGKSVQNNIEPNDYRWTLPIPPSEMRYNHNISQNPGWPTK